MKIYKIEYKLKIEVKADNEEDVWDIADSELKELLGSYNDDPIYLLCALHEEPRVINEIV